jgi:hypothetical protein
MRTLDPNTRASDEEFAQVVRRRILEEAAPAQPWDAAVGGIDGDGTPQIVGRVTRPRVPLSRRALVAFIAVCGLALAGLIAFALVRSPLMEFTREPTSESASNAREPGATPESPNTRSAGPPEGPLAQRWFDQPSAQVQAIWPNNPNGTAWFSGGEYHLLAQEPGRFVAIGAPVSTPVGDVAVQARFRKVGGPAGGSYGIIVRDGNPGQRDGLNQEGPYYVLGAGDRGEYGIWRREGSRWIDLIPWTPSPTVLPGGASNELTVVAARERLRFAINGTTVADVLDATLIEGSVGIYVGGDLNEVVVERFALDAPPGQMPG